MKRTAGVDARAVKALDMRLGGASYRQIGKALHVDHTTAMAGHWEKAIHGDVNSTRTVLTIMDRRAKLLGLDAPQRLDVTGWIREMAEAEGIDPDQAVRDAESIVRRSDLDG